MKFSSLRSPASRGAVLAWRVCAAACVPCALAPRGTSAQASPPAATARPATAQPSTVQPSTSEPAAADTAALVPTSAAAVAARAAEVPVSVGDRVRVKVWREPTLSDDFLVNDRGEVVLPQLGPVRIAGRPIAAVRDTLLARYAVYLRNPSIDVVVFRRVGVQGEVRLPNTYYVDATKSMREVITEAGGPLETAKRDHVALVRDGRTVAVTRLDNAGAVGMDLRSGDQIVVARRSWLSLNMLGVVSTLGVVVPVGLSLLNYFRK